MSPSFVQLGSGISENRSVSSVSERTATLLHKTHAHTKASNGIIIMLDA